MCSLKCSYNVVLEYLGNLKEGNFYGNRDLVRRLDFRRFCSNSSIIDLLCASLKKLIKVNRNLDCINDKLIYIVSEVLLLSYEIIKNKPGNIISSNDCSTLNKISSNWFFNANKLLRAGKYVFTPARRVHIPKKRKLNMDNSQKFRLLIVSSPRDKIVQQAMYLVLNAIYEPFFLNFSHGSRPNRGNHSALQHIKFCMRGVK